ITIRGLAALRETCYRHYKISRKRAKRVSLPASAYLALADCPCPPLAGSSYCPANRIDKEVAALVPWAILGQHACALLLVWSWVALAGFAFLPLARIRIGIAGVPLLGIVFWTVALYVLPFSGGLDVAAGLAVTLALAAGWRCWRD